jgi:uncharacterized RDD family membrane protein YckC
VSDVPPGWYPDPAAAGATPPPLRYWDGTRWTEHVSAPHPPSRPSQPTPPPYPGAYGQQYGQPSAPQYGQGSGQAYGQQYATAGYYAPRPGPTTPDGVRLAGWWHRVGATLLDGLFASIVTIAFTVPAQISIQDRTDDLDRELQRRLDADQPGTLSWFFHQLAHIYRHELGWYLIPIVVVLIAQTAFVHLLGGTPGQLLTRLRVRRRDRPGRLGWGAALVRVALFQTVTSLLLILSLLSGSLAALAVCYLLVVVWSLLDPLWAAWDAKRQTLHDKIVGTNVVRTTP